MAKVGMSKQLAMAEVGKNKQEQVGNNGRSR